MTFAVFVPLGQASPKKVEFSSLGIARLQVPDHAPSSSLVVEDAVPDGPLLGIEETNPRNLELVFE